MGLNKVWLQTLADGLVRADSAIGITTHPSPSVVGRSARWLVDVVLAATTGSGADGSWVSSPVHRTLLQTDHPSPSAPAELAGLLARLDATDAAGIITVERVGGEGTAAGVRFTFLPFTGADYSTPGAGRALPAPDHPEAPQRG